MNFFGSMMSNDTDEWLSYNETWPEINPSHTLPDTNGTQPDFQVHSTRNILIILVYCTLFVIAAIGNLTVFVSLFRSRHRKSRISLMIRHLTIADLIVTFIMIPIEVCWRLTGRWLAGNEACKIFQFLRALGPYLSSNVLVCVSLDRYFAVVYPFRINAARQRGKIMLFVAWGTSLIYCVPQCFVFHLQAHPLNPDFKQCVTFGYFSSEITELAYNLSSIMFLYFIPLVIIITAYSCIMIEISKTSQSNNDVNKKPNGKLHLRRSDTKNIERTRSRTLRLTVTIVTIYILCCTPYTIMTLWYMFDRRSAEKSLPLFLQDFFFMMVVSNSCMNPIVYGSFVIDFKKFSCQCTDCGEKTSTDSMLPHQELRPIHKSNNHHIAGRLLIKHFFGKKVNPNLTRSSPMAQQKNKIVHLEKVSKNENKQRTISYRFKHDKFYSEVLESSTSSRNEIVFNSEPAVQCVSQYSTNDRSENSLSSRIHFVDFEFVKMKPNKSCVYFLKNERTYAHCAEK